MPIPFTRAWRDRRALDARLAAGRSLLLARGDILVPTDAGALRTALVARDAAAVDALVARLDPPKAFAFGREWLDVLVVSISVAMAFRAYFYEPFNIPTGSMQPTLYGVHSVAASPAMMTQWDRQPLRFLKWAVTGERFIVCRAPSSGTLLMRPTSTGFFQIVVSTSPDTVMEIPSDAFTRRDGRVFLGTRELGAHVEAGSVLWSGTIYSGDFLFVNRFIWNFRRPRRGDVMIFATNGIDGIQQGTHYIKRMVGLPGETVSLAEPNLYIDGTAVTEPRRIGQISRREKFAPWAKPYAGFRPSGDERYAVPGRTIVTVDDHVKLGVDEYFACGDNSPESLDSRFWGPVPGPNLRGCAGGVFWPFTSPRWGPIE